MFSSLNLCKGFRQIEIGTSYIQQRAFIGENGGYQFLRMSIGLKGAPSTFQHVIDTVLRFQTAEGLFS